MSEVIQFPTARWEATLERYFAELFVRMANLGLTPQQQMDLIIQSAKDVGCVEIDGVWRLPPERTREQVHD